MDGGALLHHFGTQFLKELVADNWRESFYSGGIATATGAEYNAITDERAATAERTNQAQEHRELYEAHHEPDTLDILPYVLVQPAKLRAAKENAEAEEQRHLRDKVDAWNRKVAAESCM